MIRTLSAFPSAADTEGSQRPNVTAPALSMAPSVWSGIKLAVISPRSRTRLLSPRKRYRPEAGPSTVATEPPEVHASSDDRAASLGRLGGLVIFVAHPVAAGACSPPCAPSRS